MEFSEWLKNKYEAWSQAHNNAGRADFAIWLGVPSTSLSNWINGGFKPRRDHLAKLAKKLGNEIYVILELPGSEASLLDGLPPEQAASLRAALIELNEAYQRAGDVSSAKARSIAKEIMGKHGF